MNLEGHWEGIALEYREELEALHIDVESALTELEKGGPRSFKKAVFLLDKSLDLSQEHLHLTKLRECPTMVESSKCVGTPNKSIPVSSLVDDCFGDLL